MPNQRVLNGRGPGKVTAESFVKVVEIVLWGVVIQGKQEGDAGVKYSGSGC